MSLHREGHREETAPDAEPRARLVDEDGWRILSSTRTYSFNGAWGVLRDQMWAGYTRATNLQARATHYLLEDIKGKDVHVIEHADRQVAQERYESLVRAEADKKFPYPWSDVKGVPLHLSKKSGLTITTLYDGTRVFRIPDLAPVAPETPPGPRSAASGPESPSLSATTALTAPRAPADSSAARTP
jgi:hypothetical protein